MNNNESLLAAIEEHYEADLFLEIDSNYLGVTIGRQFKTSKP
jgi:hypothetical protein